MLYLACIILICFNSRSPFVYGSRSEMKAITNASGRYCRSILPFLSYLGKPLPERDTEKLFQLELEKRRVRSDGIWNIDFGGDRLNEPSCLWSDQFR
jgi:hypothetical protein